MWRSLYMTSFPYTSNCSQIDQNWIDRCIASSREFLAGAGARFQGCSSIQNCVFPPGSNMQGFCARNMHLWHVNFSRCSHLSGKIFNGAFSIHSCIFPEGMLMDNFTAQGMELIQVNFSSTLGFRGNMLNGAKKMERVLLPPEIDMTGFNAKGVAIKDMIFLSCSGLRPEMFRGSTITGKCAFPKDFVPDTSKESRLKKL
jgi:hypothetical protein